MNELQIFQNDEFGEIRTITIDNEPWFVAADVCRALEIGNPSQALSRLDQDEKDIISNDTLGGKQDMLFVNEPGLYSLVLGSRKPEAKDFKRWITHEVIPDIRKHGLYATDNVLNAILENPDFGIMLLTNYKEEKAKRIEAERKNAVLMHVNKTYTMTEIAKELNMKSAIELNKALKDKGIQYKVNDTWVFYSDYSNLGYEDIKQDVLDNGKVIYHRKITQLGREFILKQFR